MLFAALVLAACGGGGGGGSSNGEVSISTIDNLDGVVYPVAATVNTAEAPRVGNMGPAVTDAVWSFFTFDLAAVPAGTTVRSAYLELFQLNAFGNASVALPVLLDHMSATGQTPTWTELVGAASELEVPARDASNAPIYVTNSGTEGNRIMDVTRQIVADRAAGRRYVRFRLRYDRSSIETGGVFFSDAGSLSIPTPQLVVAYE